MSQYPDRLRQRMVQKLTQPGAMSTPSLAAEVGVPQATLSRWVREFGSVAAVSMMQNGRRADEWTAAAKLRAVMEYEGLDEQQRGEYLRGKGLHSTQVENWKQEMLRVLGGKGKVGRKADPQLKEIKALRSELKRKEKALAETAALLVLKKSSSDLGGQRRRKISEQDRRQAIELVEQSVNDGARRAKACELLGISVRTLYRWNAGTELADQRRGPKGKPQNALSDQEKGLITAVANSPAFRDLSPAQIVPILADSGVYLASEATFYRVLREGKLLAHRGRSRPRRHSRPASLQTQGPNQVWMWDITYLRSSVRGRFYYLYLVVDLWSRKIMGWEVMRRNRRSWPASSSRRRVGLMRYSAISWCCIPTTAGR